MPHVSAFRGIRYNLGCVGSLSDVVAPPYDVIDPVLQETLYTRHPANFIRLELARPRPGESLETFYDRAGQLLRYWIADGIMQIEGEPALYVYHQTYEWEGEVFQRHGFICRMQLERFGEGRIYPHEQTYPSAKADRMFLMKSCKANLSPVFGIYPDPGNDVQRMLDGHVAGTVGLEAIDEQGVQHTLWPVTDVALVSQVVAHMSELPMFIADGHHRYETACDYIDHLEQQGPLPADHPARSIMTACFSMSDPGLLVLPTHRLFVGMPEFTLDELEARLGDYFLCERVAAGAEQADLVWEKMQFDEDQGLMAFGVKRGGWLLAQATEMALEKMSQLEPQRSEAWRSLGVSLLHRLVIDELLGYKDHPKPIYVHTTAEVADTLTRESSSETSAVSFAALVRPATIDHVQEISLAAERMPAKSTYFYPKLLSGLVVNLLK